MLWTIFVILLILWILGLAASYTLRRYRRPCHSTHTRSKCSIDAVGLPPAVTGEMKKDA